MASPDHALIDQFRANLLRCRRRSGLSQEELAARTSLHRTEIGHLERGSRVPRIDTLIKLAGSLEVPPEQLLAGIEWIPAYDRQGSFRISPPLRGAVQCRGRS